MPKLIFMYDSLGGILMIKVGAALLMAFLPFSCFGSEDNGLIRHPIQSMDQAARIKLLKELQQNGIPIDFTSRRRGLALFADQENVFKEGRRVYILNVCDQKSSKLAKLHLDSELGGRFVRNGREQEEGHSWHVSIGQLSSLSSYHINAIEPIQDTAEVNIAEEPQLSDSLSDGSMTEERSIAASYSTTSSLDEIEIDKSQSSEDEPKSQDDPSPREQVDGWITIDSMANSEKIVFFSELIESKEAFELELSNDKGDVAILNDYYVASFISIFMPRSTAAERLATVNTPMAKLAQKINVHQTYYNYEEDRYTLGDFPITLNFEQIIRVRKCKIYLEDFDDIEQKKPEARKCFSLFCWF